MNSAAIALNQVRAEWIRRNPRVLGPIAVELDRTPAYVRRVFFAETLPDPQVAYALAKAGAPGFATTKTARRAS